VRRIGKGIKILEERLNKRGSELIPRGEWDVDSFCRKLRGSEKRSHEFGGKFKGGKKGGDRNGVGTRTRGGTKGRFKFDTFIRSRRGGRYFQLNSEVDYK